ncbi:MAG TPA: GNAT family N-acetyltransferase [Vicinamibacterales bacterium]|nr:GNAT family N-acetyltransferase [Vicinamibacterales bacterium]
MHIDMPQLERLTSQHAADIVSVFCEAFHAYPVMRYIVGPSDDYDERLRHLINFFVLRRVQQGGPLFGMTDNGRLLAAATTTLPAEPMMPAGAAAIRDETWRRLGDDARARYDTYAAVTKALAIERPHYHLNMIGVRSAQKGQKLARPLLEAVRNLAQEDPNSSGISLTTETSPNLSLYEHFGYQVYGHVRVSPELESWGLFLTVRE